MCDVGGITCQQSKKKQDMSIAAELWRRTREASDKGRCIEDSMFPMGETTIPKETRWRTWFVHSCTASRGADHSDRFAVQISVLENAPRDDPNPTL